MGFEGNRLFLKREYAGRVSSARTIKREKVLLEFIKKGVNLNANSILELSYHLRCVRDGEPEYRFMKSSFNHFE